MTGRARRILSFAALAACLAAALVFRNFTFIAFYPVAMSVALALAFGVSLFAEPLCLAAARAMPPGILPEGAESYCRRLTAVWCGVLAVNALIALATVFAPRAVWIAWNCALSYGMMGLVVLVERAVRRRRFAVTFHTSGSTAAPKTIVKTFDSLAREVAWHRAALANVLRAKPLFLATIEPQHMYGILWRVLLPKAAGCPVDPEVILTPEALLEKMRAAERVFLVTTPSFLARFTAYADQYDVPRNTVEIVTSGALLTPEVSAAARRVFGLAPREIFGSTETGGVAWRRQSEGTDWRVFDPVTVSSAPDGRLVVTSPFSVARGYVMGDAVTLAPDGRTFTLLGRRDRLVKINEHRVSLPEMEEALKALPEVRDAALAAIDGPRGTCLGAVIVPTDAAAIGKRVRALALRAKLLPLFPKGTVPKKYRFVSELPRNPQGKVVTAVIKGLLESELEEPTVANIVRGVDTFAADLTFDPDASYFKGHFDGFPVLPGVVQLGLAQRFASRFVCRPLVLKTVKKMKFTRAIVPGETIRFSLVRKSENEFDYRYQKGEIVCSSGTLCC